MEFNLRPTQSLTVPKQWDDFFHGSEICNAIEAELNEWWPRLFGYYLLKLGSLSADIQVNNCTISNQYSLHEMSDASVAGKVTQLPIQSSSIDVVLANFLLEFDSNPYLVLREIDRTIISGGHLILTGFNPLSPLFLGKLIPKYQHQMPWSGHFYLPSRVKDWLALLGYQVICDQRIIFNPLFSNFGKSLFWQNKLAHWLPGSGGVYILIAKKLDSPLTPVKQKTKAKAQQWRPVAGASKQLHDHSEN